MAGPKDAKEAQKLIKQLIESSEKRVEKAAKEQMSADTEELDKLVKILKANKDD